jgi:hypothetical protein
VVLSSEQLEVAVEAPPPVVVEVEAVDSRPLAVAEVEVAPSQLVVEEVAVDSRPLVAAEVKAAPSQLVVEETEAFPALHFEQAEESSQPVAEYSLPHPLVPLELSELPLQQERISSNEALFPQEEYLCFRSHLLPKLLSKNLCCPKVVWKLF